MIANHCAFLVCCFAITSNITTIKSTRNHQITPLRISTQSNCPKFLLTIDELITYNKKSISINETDVRNLSNRNVGTYSDYELKLKSIVKLEKKAKDIKCSFCVIANSKLLYLKDLFVKLKNGEPFINNEGSVTRLKEEAGLILHLLLWGNFVTGKWLWIYYLKTIAISQYEENKRFIQENPFEDNQLQSGVINFIKKCVTDNYLPETAIESDLVSKNPKVYEKIFFLLLHSRKFADILNRRAPLAPTEFLYLKPFWDDESQFLFRQIPEVNVDWSNAKQRHDGEVAITKEFVKNHTWVHDPYGRLEHQHLVIKIIDARFYCYFSVLLHIYEKQFSILDQQTLRHNKILINNVIANALDLMAYKDDFLVNIISEFRFGIIRDINDIKYILAKSKTKANEILKDLNGVSTNVIDWQSFNINEGQLSADDLQRIIDDLKLFFNDLNRFCLPFEYKMFLHFVDVVQSSST
ncbi:uncharacterized protein LOC126836333 [Adelges cooleyi]|uniref:uncharacterized protein LOC126836333 n=1 Tax=Adelges cooleyi TaxID=133065 RepID=UPI0021807C96|nr:uncharacterized protein LOC126836333 [Adelges cooleyi]